MTGGLTSRLDTSKLSHLGLADVGSSPAGEIRGLIGQTKSSFYMLSAIGTAPVPVGAEVGPYKGHVWKSLTLGPVSCHCWTEQGSRTNLNVLSVTLSTGGR